MSRIFIIFLVITGCSLSQNKPQVNENAFKVNPEEERFLRNKFSEIEPCYNFNDSSENDCVSYKYDSSEVKICFVNERNINSQSDSIAVITFSNNVKIITDTINFRQQSFISSLNFSFDIYNDYFFIAWVSENTEKNIPSVIHLECFNIVSGKKLFMHDVYSQRWGIMRLSVIYNPLTGSVLFSYNDFNESDSKYLFYGSLSFSDLTGKNPDLKPVSIFNGDNSEKRYPHFLRTDKEIYLYHTSGDTWGLLSYKGRQGIGLSYIDRKNKPAEYKVLIDRNTINNEIIIINDTVYYQHVTGTNNGVFEIKKIALKDIENY